MTALEQDRKDAKTAGAPAPAHPPELCEVTLVHADLVAELRDRLPEPHETEAVASLFKLLSDSGRCRLVMTLVEAGELCVCDLAAVAGMSQSNVSHHLGVLRARGVVRTRREGKMVYYSPDDEHVRLLLDLAHRHARHGVSREEAPGDAGGAS